MNQQFYFYIKLGNLYLLVLDLNQKEKGDLYINYRFALYPNNHLSRHVSGQIHEKIKLSEETLFKIKNAPPPLNNLMEIHGKGWGIHLFNETNFKREINLQQPNQIVDFNLFKVGILFDFYIIPENYKEDPKQSLQQLPKTQKLIQSLILSNFSPRLIVGISDFPINSKTNNVITICPFQINRPVTTRSEEWITVGPPMRIDINQLK